MIAIKNLTFQIGDFSLNNISVSIREGEYFVILGPSGAGKTVFLECLAGLHRIKHGEIWIDNANVTHLAPEKRKIGYVPQDYVLFPFLSVAENIQFGLKHGKYDKSNIRKQMISMAELLGISHLFDRDPTTLSGGEKQRVALARALVTSPRILLMDEPFSSLDLQTAKHLRLEIKKIHEELGITTLHVTHNQDEAEELADRITVIHAGKVQQTGTADDIFFSPNNETVSKFIGALNILRVDSCRSLGLGLMDVECGGIHIVLPHDDGIVQKIVISPKDVWISNLPTPGPQINHYKGRIRDITKTGIIVRIRVEVGQNILDAELPENTFTEMSLAPGMDAYLILRFRSLKTLS
jgi:molybdate/tungstate transport system ATP-binding protein